MAEVLTHFVPLQDHPRDQHDVLVYPAIENATSKRAKQAHPLRDGIPNSALLLPVGGATLSALIVRASGRGHTTSRGSCLLRLAESVACLEALVIPVE